MPCLQNLLYTLAVWAGHILTASASKCPLTEVPVYTYGCGVQGNIREPSIIRNFKNITTDIDCAELCIDHGKCRSLRRVAETSTCYIYSKHLDEMSTTLKDHQLGTLWERECWTTNCDIIASCAATESCSRFNVYFEAYAHDKWRQYACSYGKVATSSGPNGREYDVYDTTLFDGTISACEAIEGCTDATQEYPGSRDLHYDLPSNQWVCITYEDTKSEISYHPKLGQEHISRTRYSVKNDTVGAGYGFKWNGISCKPSSCE